MTQDMKQTTDEIFMRRALGLARNGAGFTSPNPMVGAVIVNPEGEIIGQGWHRHFGGPHAEVNAVRSVADPVALHNATIYVTLEPCSHYGKTPPCAKLIVESGFRRIVVGAPDPNPLVAGRGIRMIRDAGIEVTENVLRDECIEINRRFMIAQILKRPYIQLKWAQSTDGFMAATSQDGNPEPVTLSSPLTTLLMHRERSLADAVMTGTNTLLFDNPSLTLRHYPGRSLRPVIFDSLRLRRDLKVFESDPVILDPSVPLEENMKTLFSVHGISSLMVEGGAALLTSFIRAGLYDEIRVETAPVSIRQGVEAPAVPAGIPLSYRETVNDRLIETYIRHIPN